MKPATGGPGTRQARRLLRFVLPTASAIGVVVPRRAVTDLRSGLLLSAAPFGSVRRLGRLSCPAADRDVARDALFEFFPDVGGRAPAFRWYPEVHLDVVLARELFETRRSQLPTIVAAARSIRAVCSSLRSWNSGFSNSSYRVGVRPFCGSTSSSC